MYGPSWADGFARGPAECLPDFRSLWRGLVGAWVPNLGKTDSGVRDVSGYARHGSVGSNGPNWSTGPTGPMLSQTSVANSYILIGTQPALTREITIAARRRLTARTSGGYDRIAETHYNTGYYLGGGGTPGDSVTNTVPVLFILNNDTLIAPVAPATNLTQYHHFAGTYDGVSKRTYLDGVLLQTLSVNTTMTPADWYLGLDTTGVDGCTRGDLDVCCIWSRALLPREVALNSQDPLGMFTFWRRVWAISLAGPVVRRRASYSWL